MDWAGNSDQELLAAYCSLMSQLRERGMVRSSNNPVADYTESLVAKVLQLKLEGNSKAGYDAVDIAGVRYQIKGRRITPQNKSTQLSALRNLASKPFDVLAAVVFGAEFEILYGALIPFDMVMEVCGFSGHSNAHIFHFRRSVLDDTRVRDITSQLKAGATGA
jgi:hypothetical protein